MAEFSQNRLSNILQDQNSKIFVVVDVLVFPLLVIEIFQVQLPTKIRQRKPVWLVGPAQTRLDCNNVSFSELWLDFSLTSHTRVFIRKTFDVLAKQIGIQSYHHFCFAKYVNSSSVENSLSRIHPKLDRNPQKLTL